VDAAGQAHRRHRSRLISTPGAHELTTFRDDQPPSGASAWVDGAQPMPAPFIVAADPAWPEQFAALATAIGSALGSRASAVEHVGSTAVPGLAAKPVIDIDLTVADPGANRSAG
jgi:hypothetical protein